MLENAKNLLDAPEIDVFTENVKDMTYKSDRQRFRMSSILKKSFGKFYREHTGNIHNVKAMV
jgi:two-component system phosphate regulon sensor histidine kinase PhoR